MYYLVMAVDMSDPLAPKRLWDSTHFSKGSATVRADDLHKTWPDQYDIWIDVYNHTTRTDSFPVWEDKERIVAAYDHWNESQQRMHEEMLDSLEREREEKYSGDAGDECSCNLCRKTATRSEA